MNLLRVGQINISLEHVTDILPGEAIGEGPGRLIVPFQDGRTHTLQGEAAEGLRAFLDRTVKSAVLPLKDSKGV